MPESIAQQFKFLLEENLSIDLTRGKPSPSQLDLSNDLLSIAVEPLTDDGADIRNYGEPLGIHQARMLGSELLDSPITNTIAAEQSSLLLTYQSVSYTHLTLPTTPYV